MKDIVFAIILGLTLANVSIALAIKVLAQSCDSTHAGAIAGIATNLKEKQIRKYAKNNIRAFFSLC